MTRKYKVFLLVLIFSLCAVFGTGFSGLVVNQSKSNLEEDNLLIFTGILFLVFLITMIVTIQVIKRIQKNDKDADSPFLKNSLVVLIAILIALFLIYPVVNKELTNGYVENFWIIFPASSVIFVSAVFTVLIRFSKKRIHQS
jgi:cytochrome bd-type quinol oxidase subunit 2